SEPRAGGPHLRFQLEPRVGCERRPRTSWHARALHRRPRGARVRHRGRCALRRSHSGHVERRFRRHPRQAARPPAERGGGVIVYLHGFNSSPQSHKAQALKRYMAERGLGALYACPALPVSARAALRLIEDTVQGRGAVCYLGSSLGGFYATHMVEKHGGKAVLVNPAIDPHVGLRTYLGRQKNLYTGEPYELTEKHLEEWRATYVPKLSPERYLLLAETGDEVLDYRRAVSRYAGAGQVAVQGDDHSLQSFPTHLPRILSFA